MLYEASPKQVKTRFSTCEQWTSPRTIKKDGMPQIINLSKFKLKLIIVGSIDSNRSNPPTRKNIIPKFFPIDLILYIMATEIPSKNSNMIVLEVIAEPIKINNIEKIIVFLCNQKTILWQILNRKASPTLVSSLHIRWDTFQQKLKC
jgi:hypothetical protein